MPRVMHVITGLRPAGAELALLRLLQGQSPTGISVVSLIPGGDVAELIREHGVQVRSLGMRSAADLPRAAMRLRGLLGEVDVVQTWMHHADLVGGLAGAAARVPVVWGLRMGRLERGAERRTTHAVAGLNRRLASRLPAAVVACSYAVAADYSRHGYPADRMVVIPNGYDVESPPPTASLRADLGIPADARVIGRIARWHAWKDYPSFLRATAPILRDSPDVHLLLVGEGVDDANAELTASIGTLRSRIHLLGRRSDMAAVYGTLDVLCSSSSSGEGFPNVIAEAMLAQVPVVATDVGESARIVGTAGRVVPPGDAGRLETGLREVLDLSRASRLDLGRAARRSIGERYSVRSMVRAYAELHETVAARRPITSNAPVP